MHTCIHTRTYSHWHQLMHTCTHTCTHVHPQSHGHASTFPYQLLLTDIWVYTFTGAPLRCTHEHMHSHAYTWHPFSPPNRSVSYGMGRGEGEGGDIHLSTSPMNRPSVFCFVLFHTWWHSLVTLCSGFTPGSLRGSYERLRIKLR